MAQNRKPLWYDPTLPWWTVQNCKVQTTLVWTTEAFAKTYAQTEADSSGQTTLLKAHGDADWHAFYPTIVDFQPV